MNIQKVLSFTQFLGQMRNVERSIYYHDDIKRRENDAEHSRQIATLAWYIISLYKPELSLEKVLQYCLVHDIVEIYAGDEEALRRSPEQQEAKEKREEEALQRITNEMPEAHELRSLVKQYEKREDKESRFVYALDKMLPAMNIYNDGWYRWKQRKVDLDKDLLPVKEKKVACDPLIEEIRNELYAILKKEEDKLFETGIE